MSNFALSALCVAAVKVFNISIPQGFYIKVRSLWKLSIASLEHSGPHNRL